MAFVTGLLIIDAPASALNNLGKIEGAMTDNATGVKFIRTREGAYPYVSAQAFRYWLRRTLENGEWGWQAAPIYREQKIAYTDANPIRYWDDDLLGYMRAPSKKASAVEARQADDSRADETPTAETVTRVSPLRTSTLVSIAPVSLTQDFGVMARHEGDPVPHEHQFYKATLRGLLSLDLSAAGTFSHVSRSGYQNLDQVRVEEAKAKGLQAIDGAKAFRLPLGERLTRIGALLDALAHLDGGVELRFLGIDVGHHDDARRVRGGGGLGRGEHDRAFAERGAAAIDDTDCDGVGDRPSGQLSRLDRGRHGARQVDHDDAGRAVVGELPVRLLELAGRRGCGLGQRGRLRRAGPELGDRELVAVDELVVAEADGERHDRDAVLIGDRLGQVAR